MSNTNIGYMLQKDHLFEWRTIYSNMLLGLEIQGRVTPETKNTLKIFWRTTGCTNSEIPDLLNYLAE